VCHSYSDLNFGVTFFRTQCIIHYSVQRQLHKSNYSHYHTAVYTQLT